MNHNLTEILKNIDFIVQGELPSEINSIQSDSRKIQPGDLFVAINGLVTDGHQYLKQCEKSGASAVVVDKFSNEITIPQIKVKNTKKALLELANNFYENPTESMTVVGITGTNGKTTTTYLVDQILQYLEYNSGTIGTYGYSINDKKFDTDLTTPDVIQLFDIFYKMKESKVEYVIMEVSSHSIAMDRISKIKFDGAVLTNISQDHLDFHKTIDEYAKTKSQLFAMIPKSGFSIINIDDKFAKIFKSKSKSQIISYSTKKDADFMFSENTNFTHGVNGKLILRNNSYDFHSLLSGEFNMKNLLAAVAVCRNFNLPMVYILNALREITPPPGRLEEIIINGAPRVFVDYAHTPDAITNALQALKALTPENGKLISIFGCGGNRDKSKRPLMAKASEEIADFSILTSDNPRFEKPEEIIEDAKKGFSNTEAYKIIPDRKEAIEHALKYNSSNDIIAILGKGHETYQDIKGEKHHFDDKKIVREFFHETK